MARSASRLALRASHEGDAPSPLSGWLTSAWVALLFNICLLAAPVAGAMALMIAERDGLYAYTATPQITRDVRRRVERLAGEMILLDFDRRRQWDDLVALELIDGDIAAARGVLLSARAMVSPSDAAQFGASLNGVDDDARLELAALELLTPGTRSRYESTVPLLSRRSASGAAERRESEGFNVLGDERDFELMARAMLDDAQSDQLQFTLTGLGLGLGGQLSPTAATGASVLIAAARRDTFPAELRAAFAERLARTLPMNAFRAAAASSAGDRDPAAYANAAAAFTATLQPEPLAQVLLDLEDIGAASQATSPVGAGQILAHARTLTDLPRLRLVAQTAGDRAVAVAKRLAPDGRLPRAAQGLLRFNRDLNMALAVAVLTFLVVAAIAGAQIYEGVRMFLAGFRVRQAADEEEHEPLPTFERAPERHEEDLVRTFNSRRRAL